MTFGKFAKEKRIASEISLRRLSTELGFTPAYISDIERGKRDAPRPEVVRRWAEIIGADPLELQRLSLETRKSIELPVDQQSPGSMRNEAALALNRRWTEMDEDDVREILKILRKDDT